MEQFYFLIFIIVAVVFIYRAIVHPIISQITDYIIDNHTVLKEEKKVPPQYGAYNPHEYAKKFSIFRNYRNRFFGANKETVEYVQRVSDPRNRGEIIQEIIKKGTPTSKEALRILDEIELIQKIQSKSKDAHNVSRQSQITKLREDLARLEPKIIQEANEIYKGKLQTAKRLQKKFEPLQGEDIKRFWELRDELKTYAGEKADYNNQMRKAGARATEQTFKKENFEVLGVLLLFLLLAAFLLLK